MTVWNVGALRECSAGDEVLMADYPEEHGKGARSLDDSDFRAFEVAERIHDTRVRLLDGRVVRMSGRGAPVDESRDEQVVVVKFER